MNSKKINGQQAQLLVSKGAILVDVRDPVSFRDGSLPNAINIPPIKISDLIRYPKKTVFVLFGNSSSDINLTTSINYVTQWFSEVYFLESKDAWHK